jgi:SlyX protein
MIRSRCAQNTLTNCTPFYAFDATASRAGRYPKIRGGRELFRRWGAYAWMAGADELDIEARPGNGRQPVNPAHGHDTSPRSDRVAHRRFSPLAMPMNAETLERLELKIAYLEKANTDLSDVVYRQQREIETLRAQVLKLNDRLIAVTTAPTPYTAADEKPPHY